jgi:hypothetical protein
MKRPLKRRPPKQKCPKPVLKMSFLKKIRFRMMQSQSQSASVVKLRRIRGHEYLIKKIKRPVQDEHKKAMHTMPLSFESPPSTKVIPMISLSCHNGRHFQNERQMNPHAPLNKHAPTTLQVILSLSNLRKSV